MITYVRVHEGPCICTFQTCIHIHTYIYIYIYIYIIARLACFESFRPNAYMHAFMFTEARGKYVMRTSNNNMYVNTHKYAGVCVHIHTCKRAQKWVWDAFLTRKSAIFQHWPSGVLQYLETYMNTYYPCMHRITHPTWPVYARGGRRVFS